MTTTSSSWGPAQGGSYGKRFKEDARRYHGSFVSFDGRGEMIPNEQSYCELDSLKDRWGIPVAWITELTPGS